MRTTTAGPGWRRGGAVMLIAIAVALAVWATVREIGIELTVNSSGHPDVVGASDVVMATGLAGLAAWGTCALLARRAASRWWPIAGSTGLALSMIGPSYQADGSAAVALMSLHVAVGATLMLGFALDRPHPGSCCAAATRNGPA